MSGEWKKGRLEDVVDKIIDYRGKTPNKTTSGIPLITAKIVKNGRIEEPNEFIALEDYDSWMVRGFPKVGDVVMTTEAPLGEVAQIKDSNVALAQRIITLRGKKEILDNGYFKYFLQSDTGQQRLKARETGTTVTGIKQSELREVEIDLPPLSTQQKIAEILSSLDDKIELNRQMNATLEAMAQTIFKEWFVAPITEGVLPDGWREAIFENVMEAERGLSYKGSGLADENTGIPMQNLNSVYEGGGYKFVGIKYYSGDFKEKHTVKANDIIVANTEQGHKYMLIGYPAIVPEKYETSIFSHHIYRIRPKMDSYLTSDYIYHLLMQADIRDQIVGFANGTTVNMLKIEGLRKPIFKLPPQYLIEKFTKISKDIRLQQQENINQLKTLQQLRDSLLPRLMRGELMV